MARLQRLMKLLDDMHRQVDDVARQIAALQRPEPGNGAQWSTAGSKPRASKKSTTGAAAAARRRRPSRPRRRA
jgi:hypothetical protein